MGTDIYGWVELSRTRDFWYGVIRIRHLVDPSYAMFGSLFDHDNIFDFTPVAAHRGFPEYLSDAVLGEGIGPQDGVYDPTWVSWSELKVIDWQEKANLTLDETDPLSDLPTRQDVVTPGWAALFRIMEILAHEYGDERVRLVVWFDTP